MLIKWSAPMVSGAIPSYSQYISPGNFAVAQQGLADALAQYDPIHKQFNVAESACFGCHSVSDWLAYFGAVFNCPHGNAGYLRYYNIEPFLAANGSVQALGQFTANPTAGLRALRTSMHQELLHIASTEMPHLCTSRS